MRLSEAPFWSSFTFTYKDTDIYVPTDLNNVARYKPESFWDWLIYVKFPKQNAVVLAFQNFAEEEIWAKQEVMKASSALQSPAQQDAAQPTKQPLR